METNMATQRVSTEYGSFEKKEQISHAKTAPLLVSGSLLMVKDLWLSAEIKLHHIELLNQQFEIRAWLNGFWCDPELVSLLQNNAPTEEEICSQYNKYLPFTKNCFHNGSHVEFVSSPKLTIYSAEKNIVQIAYDMKATLQNRFDLKLFPFDPQFLDIQFVYRKKKFALMSECPSEWDLRSDYHFDRIVQLAMSESITEYEFFRPWIDFRKTFVLFNDASISWTSKFGLIRLPVQRLPGYYLEYVVFPLWLIVSMSICSLSMPAEEVGDRLGFLVTLLLTVAAFQYAISESLPNSAQLTIVDKYILVAYCIVCAFIVHVAVIRWISDVEYAVKIDKTISITVISIWWLYSIYSIVWKYFTHTKVHWKQISDKKMIQWIKMYSESRFKIADSSTIIT
eukprot:306789_1